jgi:hypothetical protein
MARCFVHGLLIGTFLLLGCRHGEWHPGQPLRPIGHAANRMARWVDDHPLRWVEHHPLVVEVPAAALLLTAAACALYLEAKHGTLDLSGDS